MGELRRAISPEDAAATIRQMREKAEIYRSQTMSSTSSSDSRVEPECSICGDSGTINRFEWVESGLYYSDGRPIMVEVIKVDPTTNRPPLCECQKKRIFDKYNASAGMKPSERDRFFETATLDEENRSHFEQAKRIVENIDHHLQVGQVVYIFGDQERAAKQSLSAYGTGKSYLTHCIGNELTRMKRQAIYVTEDKLFDEIKATYNKGAEETETEVLYRYQNVPVLLIDDLFKSKSTEWTEDKLFHLLDHRLEPGKLTIINSNYAPNRIHMTMPKNGPAISSRILGQSILIEMIGKDRRRARKRDGA